MVYGTHCFERKYSSLLPKQKVISCLIRLSLDSLNSKNYSVPLQLQLQVRSGRKEKFLLQIHPGFPINLNVKNKSTATLPISVALCPVPTSWNCARNHTVVLCALQFWQPLHISASSICLLLQHTPWWGQEGLVVSWAAGLPSHHLPDRCFHLFSALSKLNSFFLGSWGTTWWGGKNSREELGYKSETC